MLVSLASGRAVQGAQDQPITYSTAAATDAKERQQCSCACIWRILKALERGCKEAQAQGATCQTRDTLQLPGCAHTPCWNSSRARARLPARASSTPHVCAEHRCLSLHSLDKLNVE